MDVREIISRHYGIYPNEIEQMTPNVYYMDDGQNAFVLKKSFLTDRQLSLWKEVYQVADRQKIQSILPIYLTRSTEMYVKNDEQFVYISPYIDGKTIDIKKMYERLGEIHQQTRKEHMIDRQQIKQSFQAYQKSYEQSEKELLTYVELFEQQQYMSPLGLQVCTHYRDLQKVLAKLSEKVSDLLADQDEKFSWSISLCHGQLRFSHMLFAREVYFLNWEKASYQNATADLIDLFQSEINYYDSPMDDFIADFEQYLQAYTLSPEEETFLAIYLLDPQEYITEVRHHVNHKQQNSMIRQTKILQYHYRQLVFALNFVEQLETISEDFIEDEEDR